MTKELAIQKQVSPLVAKAEALTITSAKDMQKASAMRVALKAMANTIKTEKDKVMRPLLDAVAAERARWSIAETAISQALSYTDSKMSAYQTAEKAKADAETTKIAARVTKGTLKADTAIAKLENIETPAEVIENDDGGTKFRTVEQFEITNIKDVPVEYLLPNETMIRAAMKKGVKLPGVRYFTIETPVNTR